MNNMTYSCHVSHVMIRLKGGLFMIESRCGILCSACSYQEQVGCKGCVNIEKPFWGLSCSVKSCCETRKQKHCGQCKNFPCELLKQFAYDEKEGDNGKRIEQCRCWSKE